MLNVLNVHFLVAYRSIVSFLYLSPISVQLRARQKNVMTYFVEVSSRLTKIIIADVLSICDLTELEPIYH